MSGHFVFPPSEHENLPLEPEVDEHVGEDRICEVTKEYSVSSEHDEEQNELDSLDGRGGQRQFAGMQMHSEEEEAYQSKGVEVFGKDVDLKNSKTVYDGDIQPEIPPAIWWKRHAASLYSNAKESNSFWSIVVATAVMGLVIIGQRWQQERWQVLQLKFKIK